MSPPMTSRTLEEETVATLSVVFPSVEEEPPNGDIAKEARQPMQGVQAIQDPEASQLPTSQSPQLEQTPSPIKTVIPQKVLSTETLGGASLSKQTSGPCFFFFFLTLFLFCPSLFFSSPFEFFLSFLFLGQASVRSAPSVASSLESKDFEGGCRSSLLCFLFFLFFFFSFMPFPCLLLLWRSPMRLYLLSAVMLRFSHPFFNLLCVFSQSLLRNQRSKRRRFCPMRPILVSLFPLFFFFTASPLFFLTKSVSPFFVSCCLGF